MPLPQGCEAKLSKAWTVARAQSGLPRTVTAFRHSVTDIDPPKSTERLDVGATNADHVENHGPGSDSEGNAEKDGVDKCAAIREPCFDLVISDK